MCLGLVDHTHAAAAQFFDNAVVRDGLADHLESPCPSGRFILRSRIRSSTNASFGEKLEYQRVTGSVCCRPRALHPGTRRLGQHFVKGRVASKFCQQRIGKQIFVRAIVLLDGALEQVERRLLLAAIGKEDSLVVPRLRVGVGGLAAFGFLRHTVEIVAGRNWRHASSKSRR